MKNYLIRLLLTAIAVWFGSKNLKDISVDNYTTAILVAVALGFLNTFVKPVLKLLSLPVTVLTLGLFLLVINVAIIYIAAYFIQGFKVSGFMGPLLFSIGLSVVGCVLNLFFD
jgi:putative membrane protein